ncbi:MAG: hypothetical protein KY449_02305, partial [Proteobacteria bacterium]|nr:hypothetical protein [Pseudomonadota bacterium]
MFSQRWRVAALAWAALSLSACGEPVEADAAPSTARPVPAGSGTGAPAFQIERSAVHTLRSARLGRTYEVFVKTPPGYDKP